jgi:RNA polymerase sigma-70 factor (ECF subfamily)
MRGDGYPGVAPDHQVANTTSPTAAFGLKASERENLTMITDQEFTDLWTDTVRPLRSYALWLSRDRRMVDDLVQQAALQAWAARHTLRPGGNPRAWLFVILRNCHYSRLRRRRFEVEDPDGTLTENFAIYPGYHADRDLADVRVAMKDLPEKLRRALTHVVFGGLSYAETARLCSCKVGTIKSRVARARELLLQMVDGLPLSS